METAITGFVDTPRAPKELGPYTIEQEVGRGGICIVYKAVQQSLDRPIAVKIIAPEHRDDADLLGRFQRESRILGKLSHPNIVHVFDSGEFDGRPYFTMEYIDGVDFKHIIRREKRPLADLVRIVIQVLHALEYAHSQGVVHRDIKPANILVDRDGHARLTDFGIARLSYPDQHEATQTGQVMGTVAYMAPEQRASAKSSDARSDIYSIGVILYEIATGQKPVGRFKPPSQLNRELPRDFDAIILRCLEPNPAMRYDHAQALRVELERIAERLSMEATNAPPSTIVGVDSFIGKCRFLETIGESDGGTTYLVENSADQRLHVIKKITGREADVPTIRKMVYLRHPHILPVYGAGADLRKTVIVSDYASGGALAGRMSRHWLEEEVIPVMRQMGEALDFAHKNEVLHGNLKPSNVLFDERDQVLLTDFGLKASGSKRQQWWRAPELSTGRSVAGDLFSLGAVAYRMIYGDRPRWNDEEPFFPARRDQVSLALRRVLRKLLHRDPAKRYAIAEEFLLELNQADGLLSVKPSDAVAEKVEKTDSRYAPVIWATVGVLVLAAILIYLLAAW